MLHKHKVGPDPFPLKLRVFGPFCFVLPFLTEVSDTSAALWAFLGSPAEKGHCCACLRALERTDVSNTISGKKLSKTCLAVGFLDSVWERAALNGKGQPLWKSSSLCMNKRLQDDAPSMTALAWKSSQSSAENLFPPWPWEVFQKSFSSGKELWPSGFKQSGLIKPLKKHTELTQKTNWQRICQDISTVEYI